MKLMLWTITWTGELPQRKTRGYKTDLNVRFKQLNLHCYKDFRSQV